MARPGFEADPQGRHGTARRPPLPEHALWLLAAERHGPALLARMGGKARQLHGLAVDGFPVLPGLVLLPELALGCLEPGERWPQRIPPTLLADLRSALAPWSAAGPLAVRSSAAEEDGGERSYAGQFLTLLDVDAAGLEAAILAVWRSAGSESLAAYRGPDADGATAAGGPWPAVLIQPMLRPRRAGVAFAADPVSGRRGVTLIAAVAGGSADLLAGTARGDHYELDRHGRLHSSQLLSSEQPLLSVDECGRIAALVRRLSHRLAAPRTSSGR